MPLFCGIKVFSEFYIRNVINLSKTSWGSATFTTCVLPTLFWFTFFNITMAGASVATVAYIANYKMIFCKKSDFRNWSATLKSVWPPLCLPPTKRIWMLYKRSSKHYFALVFMPSGHFGPHFWRKLPFCASKYNSSGLFNLNLAPFYLNLASFWQHKPL